MDTESIDLLKQIQSSLQIVQHENRSLAASVEALNLKVDDLSRVKKSESDEASNSNVLPSAASNTSKSTSSATATPLLNIPSASSSLNNEATVDPNARRGGLTSRIILTTYPGQSGIDPLPMKWGDKDPAVRGPVTVSRHAGTVRRRNGMCLNSGVVLR